MILWTIKLLTTAKKAIAGRKYPHQLAWATAFGLLLGIVPHGNLLAVVLLIIVMTLKLNHAMAALTAIATSFLIASRLDPYSHLIGDELLTHPQIHPLAVSAWQLPLVPWTDLNNTVVMGSFLIGIVALVPVFVITYPIFRLFAPQIALAPASENSSRSMRPADARPTEAGSHSVVMVDQRHSGVAAPHTSDAIPFEELSSQPSENAQPMQQADSRVAVETRIDVIRMKGQRPAVASSGVDSNGTAAIDNQSNSTNEKPMDEALNYLLRQLRDSQQRSAA